MSESSILQRPGGLPARVVTGLVLATAALVAVYSGGRALLVLLLAFALAMSYEWNQLSQGKGFGPTAAIHAAAVVAALILVDAGRYEWAVAAMLAGGAAAGLACVATGGRSMWAAAGAIYVAAPVISAMWLRDHGEVGMALVIWVFAVVWLTDTGAFFFGKLIGGPKLTPVLSPEKTWAGLAGGLLFGTAAGLGAAQTMDASLTTLIAFSLVLSLAAHGGDLAESALKRRFDAKDSGHMVPGHGGILDTVDGAVTALPAAVLIIMIHGNPFL